jgi:hypothetical protein
VGIFKHRPTQVAARQVTWDSIVDVKEWCDAEMTYSRAGIATGIQFNNGGDFIPLGYWVVKGSFNDFFVCTPQEFAALYEEVRD